MTDETPLTVAADLATLQDPKASHAEALARVEAEIERLTDAQRLANQNANALRGRAEAAERALAKAQESADGWQAEAEEYERRLRLYDAPAPWEARLALAEAMCEKHERALAEACGVIDALAGQQAMPDDFWREPLARFRALAASAPQETQP